MTDYEKAFVFVLDDAAYEVGRGTRPMALLDVSEACWRANVEPAARSAEFHSVLIVYERGQVIVAAAPWVLELYRVSSSLDARSMHALVGLLLGYSPRKIEEFLSSVGDARLRSASSTANEIGGAKGASGHSRGEIKR